jgi:hypothetical protein
VTVLPVSPADWRMTTPTISRRSDPEQVCENVCEVVPVAPQLNPVEASWAMATYRPPDQVVSM